MSPPRLHDQRRCFKRLYIFFPVLNSLKHEILLSFFLSCFYVTQVTWWQLTRRWCHRIFFPNVLGSVSQFDTHIFHGNFFHDQPGEVTLNGGWTVRESGPKMAETFRFGNYSPEESRSSYMDMMIWYSIHLCYSTIKSSRWIPRKET